MLLLDSSSLQEILCCPSNQLSLSYKLAENGNHLIIRKTVLTTIRKVFLSKKKPKKPKKTLMLASRMYRPRQCRGTFGALWGFSERRLQLDFAAGSLLSCRGCDLVCLLLPQMSLWSTMNSLRCLGKTHQPVNLDSCCVFLCSC